MIPIPRSIRCLFLSFAAFVLSSAGSAWSADLIIASGGSRTLDAPLSLTTEKYGNEGTLNILAGGVLTIGSDVTNNVALPEGTLGLDLGKVISDGSIDADQAIRFQANSQLGGTVHSSDRIIFDGVVAIKGKLSAETIVFNSSSDTTSYSSIDLTGSGAELETDRLIVSGRVAVTQTSQKAFEIQALELGKSGSVLNVSGDIIITDNFYAAAGSTLASQLDEAGVGQGNILLKNDGEFFEGTEDLGGFHHLIGGTLKAKNVTIQGRTCFFAFANSTGDLVLDEDSYALVGEGIVVGGALTLEEGAEIQFAGNAEDGSHMVGFGLYAYNGIFYEGFELKEGSKMSSETGADALFFALLGDSTIHAGATFSSQGVFLSGVDEYGDASKRTVTNAGTMKSKMLYLRSVELKNLDDGTIDATNLTLIDNAVLDLSGNNADNGGLSFSGDNKSLYIGVNSQLKAGNGKTLELVGVTVENRNTDGGIYATNLRFGEGSILFGNGKVLADTVFGEKSKLILGLNYIDFGTKDVLFESGSTIAMTIDPAGYGTLLSTGTVKTEDGVLLEIVDGSNFEGRTQYFCVAQGGSGSSFSEDMQFVDSLFFNLSRVIPLEDENQLWVEIIKVADLVDYAGSENQRQFAQMIDGLLADDGANDKQKKVFDSLMRIASDSEYRQALSSLSGDLRSNGLLAAIAEPWRVPLERVGMRRLSVAVPKRKRSASVTSVDLATEVLGQTPSMFQGDFWFDTYYNHLNLRSDSNASGGKGDRAGFNLGAEWTPTNETLFGWTFGYGNGGYTQDDGHLVINDYQFGLYGGANLFKRNFQVRGYVGYGHLDFTQDRRVSLPGAYYTARGSTPGDSISASLMLVRPVDLSDRFLFKPTFSIDFERVSQKGFTEYGDPGIRLSYDSAEFARTMLRFGASGERSFQRGSIWGRLFYGVKVAGDNVAVSMNRFAGTSGPDVSVYSVDIGDSVFDLGFGGKHSLNAAQSVLMFVDYNGSFAKRSDSHTGSFGIIWKR